MARGVYYHVSHHGVPKRYYILGIWPLAIHWKAEIRNRESRIEPTGRFDGQGRIGVRRVDHHHAMGRNHVPMYSMKISVVLSGRPVVCVCEPSESVVWVWAPLLAMLCVCAPLLAMVCVCEPSVCVCPESLTV